MGEKRENKKKKKGVWVVVVYAFRSVKCGVLNTSTETLCTDICMYDVYCDFLSELTDQRATNTCFHIL